jgi:hypothetical protein
VLRPKNAQNSTYINKEKSTFAEKNLKLLHGPIFLILWEKYIFSSKTSSDRLKATYRRNSLIKEALWV